MRPKQQLIVGERFQNYAYKPYQRMYLQVCSSATAITVCLLVGADHRPYSRCELLQATGTVQPQPQLCLCLWRQLDWLVQGGIDCIGKIAANQRKKLNKMPQATLYLDGPLHRHQSYLNQLKSPALQGEHQP